MYFGIPRDWPNDPACSKNPATKVVAVSTPNGEQTPLSALKGTHMYKDQMVTADHDAQLTFGDGSVYPGHQRDHLHGHGCDTSTSDEPHNFANQILLKWGTVWGRDPNKEAPRMMTPTQTSRLGRASPVYWVSYRDRVMTVTVKKGSVWVQRIHGNKLVGKAWIVKAGHTAKVRRHHDPVVKNTKASAPTPGAVGTSRQAPASQQRRRRTKPDAGTVRLTCLCESGQRTGGKVMQGPTLRSGTLEAPRITGGMSAAGVGTLLVGVAVAVR